MLPRFLASGLGLLLLGGCSAGPSLTAAHNLNRPSREATSAVHAHATGKGRARADDPLERQRDRASTYGHRESGLSVAPLLGLGSLHGLVLGAEVTRSFGVRDGAHRDKVAVGGTVSLLTGGLWGRLGYERRNLVGDLDAGARLEGQTSRRRRRIFGLGNDTPFLETDIAGLAWPWVEVEPRIGMTRDDGFSWRLGGTLRHTDLGPPHAAAVTPEQHALPPGDFSPHTHGGGFVSLEWERVDGGAFPIQGFRVEGRGDLRAALVDAASTYGTLDGRATVYLPLSRQQPAVLALRVGGAHRVGDFPVYDAATVGGNTLRGFYGHRFAGRTAAYGNAELRLRLFTVTIIPIPIDVGALAFADVGRVWLEDRPSRTWHVGGGGGLWLGLMKHLVGQGTLYATETGIGLSAGLGFRF